MNYYQISSKLSNKLQIKKFFLISPMPSCVFLKCRKKQRRAAFQYLNPFCQAVRPGVVITERPLNRKPFLSRSPQAKTNQTIKPFIDRAKNYKHVFNFYQKTLEEAPDSKLYEKLETFFKGSIPLTALFLFWMRDYVISDPEACAPLKKFTDSFNSFLKPYQIPIISANKLRSAMEIVWKYSNSGSTVSSMNMKRISRGNLLEGVKVKNNTTEKGGLTYANGLGSF